MSMNEFLWKSSDAAAEIRLLVEGAIALYEGDATQNGGEMMFS